MYKLTTCSSLTLKLLKTKVNRNTSPSSSAACKLYSTLRRKSEQQAHPLLQARCSQCLARKLKESPFQNQAISARQFSAEGFKYLFSADFLPNAVFIQVLNSVHTYTGLPWWATITITTISLRTIFTLPFTVMSVNNMYKLHKVRNSLAHISKGLKIEIAQLKQRDGLDYKTAKSLFIANMKHHTRKLYIEENCHPAKTYIVPVIQIPLWISMSMALRNMSGCLPILGTDVTVLNPELATEGIFWFSNLLLPDATWILPVAVGLMNIAIVEMQMLKMPTLSRPQKFLQYFLRGVGIVIIPIAAAVPSCIAYYWACSAFYGLVQNIVLSYPRCRHAIGMPATKNDSNEPFKQMWTTAKKRYGRSKM